MPDRPLLVLRPEVEERRPAGRQRNPGQLSLPSKDRQVERIGPVFSRLEQAFQVADAGDSVALLATADGLEPERTLVFEVAGAAASLAAAVEKLAGLEFQLEEQIEFEADADFRKSPDDTTSVVGGRLYACIPDVEALRQLLSLWKLFERGEPLPRGKAPWRDFFSKLKNIRPWGPEERLPESTRDYIEMALANGKPTVRLEAELWFRPTAEKRNLALRDVRSASPEMNIISECVLEEIRYHAILLEISPSAARDLLANPSSGIGSASGVMLVRPQSLVEVADEDLAVLDGPNELSSPVDRAGSPIRIGVLDGMPLHRHEVLDGRIFLDDPDGLEASSPPGKRTHGTAMASLVLNGDLNRPSSGPHTIYVRPILQYDPIAAEERTPAHSFPLDLVFRAVRRIKEGEAGIEAVCPTVVVINLSLGDENQPFTGRASPWAKLIDFLAHKYQILFVISAGNITAPLLTTVPTLTAFEALTLIEREREVVSSLFRARGRRTILSPAEAANAITVGASYEDGFPHRDRTGMSFRPYATDGLPNLSSGLGLGVRRSVKPDMIFDGGKEPVNASPTAAGIQLSPGRSGSPFFGHKVAAPSSTGQLNSTTTSSGSSDAAALVTNRLAGIVGALDPEGAEDSLRTPDNYLAVTAKALALHSCAWAEPAERLSSIVGPPAPSEWRRRRYNIASGMGCGRPAFDRVVESTRNRAVMVHWGELSQDQSQVFRIPIPSELNGLEEFRRVAITAAWLSPINPSRAHHRKARFEIDAVDEGGFWIGDAVTEQPLRDSLMNGTAAQICLSGTDVIALAHADGLGFRLSCRAQYDRLTEPVSFAVAVSLELATSTSIDVYERVRTVLRERVAARVSVGT